MVESTLSAVKYRKNVAILVKLNFFYLNIKVSNGFMKALHGSRELH